MLSFFRTCVFSGVALFLLFSIVGADAQDAAPTGVKAESSSATLPDAPDGQAPAGQTEKNPNVTNGQANKDAPAGQQQPKRILGLMPNYRAVSAGAIPPPPTSKESFKLAGQNTFDYSSFVFVGLTSLIAKGEDAHPALGKGVGGYWAYTWRGFVDKADGNYLVIWALPTILHEDERFYAKGEGRKFNRGVYAATRVFITPNYQGKNTFNAAELIGRGAAQGISLSYYPSSDRTLGDFTEKFGYAVMRDAATNAFREFWPDIATHVLHIHPKS
jgi:hypothetical protein